MDIAPDLPVAQQQPNGGLAPAYPQGLPVGPTADDLDGGDGFSVLGLLHSLRRQLLLALGLGLFVSTLLAILLYFFIPVTFTAEAVLKVDRELIPGHPSDYMIYKETQASLLNSNFVVTAALRDNDINQLPMVVSDGRGFRRKRPVAWLSSQINVIQGEDELIGARLNGRDLKQTEALLDGVIKAYLTEIVNKERLEKVAQLSKLRKRYATVYEQVSKQTDEIATIAKTLGTSDNETSIRQQSVKIQELNETRREIDRLRRVYSETLSKFKMLNTQMQLGNSMNPTDFQILDEMERDRRYVELTALIDQFKDTLEQMSATLRPGSAQMVQYQNEIGRLENKREQMLAEMRPRIIARIKSSTGSSAQDIQGEMMMVRTQLLDLQAQATQMQEVYNGRYEEAMKYGGSSGALEVKKDALTALRRDMMTVRGDMQLLEIEIDGPERVSVIQNAGVTKASNWMSKIIQIGGGWLISLLGTMFAIAYWDYLAKRVNGEEDISRSIRVVGTLPGIQKGLVEEAMKISIDGIRTAILFNRNIETQCVLVTSATGQEGRSTVASQLAVSMGRAGKATLLVDGDLRNPQQHNIFGVQPNGGLSEMLRGEQTSDQAIVATAVENVWLLSAGRCDQTALQGLSGDQAKAVFQDFRDRFDMIIIDASPVLTGADALLLGQFADTAIISVRRDVSQMPKVNAASDRLASVGIPILGSVVNGSTIEMRSGEQAVSAAASEQPALTNA